MFRKNNSNLRHAHTFLSPTFVSHSFACTSPYHALHCTPGLIQVLSNLAFPDRIGGDGVCGSVWSVWLHFIVSGVQASKVIYLPLMIMSYCNVSHICSQFRLCAFCLFPFAVFSCVTLGPALNSSQTGPPTSPLSRARLVFFFYLLVFLCVSVYVCLCVCVGLCRKDCVQGAMCNGTITPLSIHAPSPSPMFFFPFFCLGTWLSLCFPHAPFVPPFLPFPQKTIFYLPTWTLSTVHEGRVVPL
jgi:hypothetical protein